MEKFEDHPMSPELWDGHALQVAYLTLPNAIRFKVKVWAEVVVARLVKMGAPFITQILLVIFGSLSQVSIYVGLFSILTLIIALLVIKKIGGRKGTDGENLLSVQN